MSLVTTLSIDIQHNSIECHYAECRDYLNVMLNVVMLSVVAPVNELYLQGVDLIKLFGGKFTLFCEQNLYR